MVLPIDTTMNHPGCGLVTVPGGTRVPIIPYPLSA